MAQSMVDPDMLEACVRDVLNVTAPRAMAVLTPLKVVIDNFPSEEIQIEVPDFPSDPISPLHKVPFGRTIYIENSDFRETDEKGYRRLKPNQAVGLRHTGYILRVSRVNKVRFVSF